MQAEKQTRCNTSLMTIKEFQVSLENKVKNLKTFTVPLKFAAFDATAMMGERIFDKGQDVDDLPISRPGYSTYSTKPIYINPNNLKIMGVPGSIGKPIGKPKGKKKTGSRKNTTTKVKGELFAVEGKRKTVYLDGGYKELRNKLGRRIDIVDLKLSGELRQDFSKSKSAPAKPTKINELEWQIKLDKNINAKKREGLEDKYGTIFSLTEGEKEKFYETLSFKFREALQAK